MVVRLGTDDWGLGTDDWGLTTDDWGLTTGGRATGDNTLPCGIAFPPVIPIAAKDRCRYPDPTPNRKRHRKVQDLTRNRGGRGELHAVEYEPKDTVLLRVLRGSA